jgi:hypothetical protein
MNIPGNIYKTNEGLCFVPDVFPSFDEIMELMKLKMIVSSEGYIEDDWQHVKTVTVTKYEQHGLNVHMLDEGINAED